LSIAWASELKMRRQVGTDAPEFDINHLLPPTLMLPSSFTISNIPSYFFLVAKFLVSSAERLAIMIWSSVRKPKWQRVPSKSLEDDESAEGFITQKPEYRDNMPKRKSRFLVPVLSISNLVTLGLLLYTFFSLRTPTEKNAALKATSFFCESTQLT
jgi:hypothetical protein